MSSIKWLDEEPSNGDTYNEQPALRLDDDTPSIRYYNTPSTFDALLSLENFYSLLSKSFVFIHNKKSCSDDLVDRLIRDYRGKFDIKQIQTHQFSAGDIMRKIKDGLRLRVKQRIWIVESTSPSDDLSGFCTKVFMAKNERHGVWIRGSLNELSPKTVQLFDVLFLFDMSSTEYDVLRTAILTPSNLAEQLVTHYGAMNDMHRMLAFVNYKRLPRAPLLTSNPIILLTRNKEADYLMDITPFIPLIVKATEYIFTEAKEYLTKGRSQAKDASDNTIALPITEQQFDNARLNMDKFSSMMTTSITRADIYELEQLLKKVELHRKLISTMETANVLNNDPRIAVQIVEEKDKVVESTVKIQELLTRLYKK